MPVVVALAPLILALMALLLIYGLKVFGKGVSHLFPSSIGIGAVSISPRDWVESAIDALSTAIGWLVGDVIRPMIGFLARPVLAVIGYLQSVGNFILTAGQAIAWIITEGIPAALTAAKTLAIKLAGQVTAYAAKLYREAVAYAAKLVRLVRVYAHGLYVLAERYAARLVHAVRVYAAALVLASAKELRNSISLARTYSLGLVKAATADLTRLIARIEARLTKVETTVLAGVSTAAAAAVKTAEAYTNTALLNLPGVLATDIGQVIAPTFSGLIDDVGKLEGIIGTDLPDIRAAIDAIPRALPLDLAGEMAIGLSVARVMTRYMEQCGVPNCRNLSKVGRDLQDLFGIVEGAGLLTLIGYMVTDPGGAAREADDVLTPVASGLIHAARDLIGV